MSLSVADLRPISLFEGLPDADVQAWIDVAQERLYTPGESILREGELVDDFLMLLTGRTRQTSTVGGVQEPSGFQEGPTFMGAIAMLTGEAFPIAVFADTPCRCATVALDDLRRLLFAQPTVMYRVMRVFRPIYRRMDNYEAQRDKLVGLGTMAAGLAHELNNPAAAARRSAEELAEAIDVVSSTIRVFVESGMERDAAEGLVRLQVEAVRRAAAAIEDDGGDPLAASDREDEVTGWLEARGLPEPWRLAEPLAVAGVDEAWLDDVARLAGSATEDALRWVAATVTARAIAEELRSSTARMSDLVGAVKAYAYMDQGSLQEVDVRRDLENTITILGHKLKRTTIDIERDYAKDLPLPCAYGSQLNQVWTNLLDNAIDALGDSGTITVRAAAAPDGDLVVQIADDGPGIPDDVIGRIFDPFYTTKDVGAGTGLGLETARRIVVDRHGGSIDVASEPGRTCFTVTLHPTPPA